MREKNFLFVFSCLLLILAGDICFGQCLVYFSYYGNGNPPLECGGMTLPEGTGIYVLHDWQGNGYDAADTAVAAFSMNYTGYFEAPAGIFMSCDVPHPDYYLRLGRDECCIRSEIFHFTDGFLEFDLTWENWHFENGPCPVIMPPPPAPTNCVASDDELCLEVHISWDHVGGNVAGFSIYQDNDVLVGQTSSHNRDYYLISAGGVHSYYVRADNIGGNSLPSNSDSGSTYLLRFANDPTGDIQGINLAHTEHNLVFDSPTGEFCQSTVWLYMIYNANANPVRGPLLGHDSLVTTMTFTLPNDNTQHFCRVLMRDSSWAVGTIYYDTTASTFDLGANDVSGDRDNSHPDKFILNQNYPNPFNPRTVIEYTLAKSEKVLLKVFDVLGKEVETLAEGNQTAGTHQIEFDGAKLPSGAYLYRVETESFSETKKMLLLK